MKQYCMQLIAHNEDKHETERFSMIKAIIADISSHNKKLCGS